MKPFYSSAPDGVIVELHVQPGASKSGWSGRFGDRLKLRISAKAVEGQANETLIAFIAKFLGVAKSRVSIIRGEKSREKTILITGEGSAVLQKLEQLAISDFAGS
jgi:uncharacterized protein